METHGVASGGGDGRGNLRENREDPAPTVGVAGMPLRSKCRPIADFTMPSPSTPHTSSHEPRGFYHDAAWEGRALALLGTAPTESAIAYLEN